VFPAGCCGFDCRCKRYLFGGFIEYISSKIWTEYAMIRIATLTLAALAGAVSLAGMPTGALAADSGHRSITSCGFTPPSPNSNKSWSAITGKTRRCPPTIAWAFSPSASLPKLEDSPTNKVYVLVPCDSLEVFAAIPARLAADAAYQAAAAEYMALPKSSPAYERIESSLNVAFDSMKKLAAPPSAADKTPWIFELRTYQSPSESKGINKVQMFNSGEVP
jgi:hypothetical protein